jgi:hypothetical protein
MIDPHVFWVLCLVLIPMFIGSFDITFIMKHRISLEDETNEGSPVGIMSVSDRPGPLYR